LHAAGDVFVRTLAPGQSMLVKSTALVFKDPSVRMQLHFEHVNSGSGINVVSSLASVFGSGFGSNLLSNALGAASFGARHLWLRLQGPGRVAVQSVFERADGENRIIRNASMATNQYW
jgi:uncharacterized protein (AIM24 family)